MLVCELVIGLSFLISQGLLPHAHTIVVSCHHFWTFYSVAKCLGAKKVCRRSFDWLREHSIVSCVVSDSEALKACVGFAGEILPTWDSVGGCLDERHSSCLLNTANMITRPLLPPQMSTESMFHQLAVLLWLLSMEMYWHSCRRKGDYHLPYKVEWWSSCVEAVGLTHTR